MAFVPCLVPCSVPDAMQHGAFEAGAAAAVAAGGAAGGQESDCAGSEGLGAKAGARLPNPGMLGMLSRRPRSSHPMRFVMGPAVVISACASFLALHGQLAPLLHPARSRCFATELGWIWWCISPSHALLPPVWGRQALVFRSC